MSSKLTSRYHGLILEALEGHTSEFDGIPFSRLDWYGLGAVLDLYQQSSGTDRENIIRAIAQILEGATEPPIILAQLLHLVASLDIAQVEPSVLKLNSMAIAGEEPVKGALANYFTFRQVARREHAGNI